jgi:hypothetical protein
MGHIFRIKTEIHVCLTQHKFQMRALLYIVLLIIAGIDVANGQDPQRFKKEVRDIKAKDSLLTNHKNLVLFTGSSSIRLWSDLRQRFTEFNVWNTAFGGSQTSDLFFFADDLIIPYKPKKIFIYEGDNDIGEGKNPDEILKDTDKLLKFVRGQLPRRTRIYFITPKPSIRRWELKAKYEDYISKLKIWASGQKRVTVVDVWSPMLDEKGELRKDLFIEDNLHMNSKGYDIWTKVLMPYLKKK